MALAREARPECKAAIVERPARLRGDGPAFQHVRRRRQHAQQESAGIVQFMKNCQHQHAIELQIKFRDGGVFVQILLSYRDRDAVALLATRIDLRRNRSQTDRQSRAVICDKVF